MSERWNSEEGKSVIAPAVDAFLDELVAVCKKHGMSLGHEDHHGAFEVYPEFLPDAIEWLKEANVSKWWPKQ